MPTAKLTPGIGIAGLLVGLGLAATGLSARETAQLGPYVVNEAPLADGWRRAHFEDTTVLSELSERATRELTTEILIFAAFLRATCPEAAMPPGTRMRIVICRDHPSLATFSATRDTVASVAAGRDALIVVDASDHNHLNRAAKRQWARCGLITNSRGGRPLWEVFGWAELLGAALVTADDVEVGYPPHRYEGIHYPHHVTNFQFGVGYGQFGPLDRMFARTALPTDPDERYAFEMQAAAFVHQCRFGLAYRKWREPYEVFVRRLASEPYSEKLFQECFHLSTRDAQWAANDYLFGSEFRYETVRYRHHFQPSFEVALATVKEVADARTFCAPLRR